MFRVNAGENWETVSVLQHALKKRACNQQNLWKLQ